MSRKLIHTKTEKKANKIPETQLRIEPLKHTSQAKSIKGKETEPEPNIQTLITPTQAENEPKRPSFLCKLYQFNVKKANIYQN